MPGYRRYRPYKRTRKYYKKSSKSSYGGSSLSNVARIASTALSTAKFVAGLVNAEKKWFDVSATPTVSNAGSVTWLSDITQGTGATQMLGNSVKLASVQMRLNASLNTASSASTIRVILFQNMEGIGSLPTALQVLASTTGTQGVNAPMNMDNSKRFRILVDRRFKLDSNGSQSYIWQTYKKLDTHLKYDQSGTNAQANVEQGHVYLLLISDQSANLPECDYYVRFRFYDN